MWCSDSGSRQSTASSGRSANPGGSEPSPSRPAASAGRTAPRLRQQDRHGAAQNDAELVLASLPPERESPPRPADAKVSAPDAPRLQGRREDGKFSGFRADACCWDCCAGLCPARRRRAEQPMLVFPSSRLPAISVGQCGPVTTRQFLQAGCSGAALGVIRGRRWRRLCTFRWPRAVAARSF